MCIRDRYQRRVHGIFNENSNSLSNYLFFKILGVEVEEKQFSSVHSSTMLSAKGLPILNSYQISAVRKALISPLCIIQGPPGTGKTITSASIVYNIVKTYKNTMLVCAPSNIAVDQLTEKIHATGLKVLRLCAKSRESISSSVENLTLHKQVRELKGKKFDLLQKLFKLKEKTLSLIHISEPTRPLYISYAVFCLKKKKKNTNTTNKN
eukprot:TRINITY_DN19067_c0_g2_i1.p1 TRINITY_DN19067_c0_g2~~TRINITY_DN19067_c0_g2_i1.p1  ORF type:complete len:208 (-),score=44.66 TRINITY_DN19067_c0_g2_i1:57-680(-)